MARPSLSFFVPLLFSLFGASCAADHARSDLLAQRGAMTCTQDADCARRMRMPRPRRCPNGSSSNPSACCRMGYCGVCWSECGR